MENTGGKQMARDDTGGLLAQIRSEHGWLWQMMNIVPVDIVITDATGNVLMINEEAERIQKHKFSPPVNIDEYAEWRLLYKGGKPMDMEEFPLYRALHRGEIVKNEEMRILNDDGTTTPISTSTAPIYDSGGRLTNGILIIVDITNKERCEDSLLGLSRERRWR